MKKLTAPMAFVWLAALITVIYLIGHVLGWRELTAFLSGSALPGGTTHGSLWAGLVYTLAYFAFQVLVPILLLAAGIRFALAKWLEPQATHPAPAPTEPQP